jgi:hypothetical protein
MAGPLSDQAFAQICAAAEPYRPDVEARAELSKFLFEGALAYDRARWAKDYRRAERMLKHLAAFAKDYGHRWLPNLPDDQLQTVLGGHAMPLTDDVKTREHCLMLQKLWERAWLLLEGAAAIRQANEGRKRSKRELLYNRLSRVWLDHFGAADLTYSVPSLGGPPYGPLIRFMLASLRQVMPETALPSAETLRDAIDRERRDLEQCRQDLLQLRQRTMGF